MPRALGVVQGSEAVDRPDRAARIADEIARFDRLFPREGARLDWAGHLTFRTIGAAALHPDVLRQVQDAFPGRFPLVGREECGFTLIMPVQDDGNVGKFEVAAIAASVCTLVTSVEVEQTQIIPL